LSEAAFLTGVERNADVVQLATYAPLLAHTDAWQWNPDLIWFDNLRMVRSVNYYVQQLFSYNKGTNVLPLTHNGSTVAGENQLYASSVIDTGKKEIIIKLVNVATTNRDIRIQIKNINKGITLSQNVYATILSGEMTEENTLDEPENTIPKDYQLTLSGNELDLHVEKQSFNVYRITY
jgi:alpha-L-arabinofuranosidase